MAGPTDTAIRELLDRSAIRDLLLRYAQGVDRRDLTLVAACFVPGAAYEGSLGHGTIETALDGLHARMSRYTSTMHFIGNQHIELDGDRATSETYALAYHQFEADGLPQLRIVAVRYFDELVRRGDAWRICRRLVKMDWQRTDRLDAPP